MTKIEKRLSLALNSVAVCRRYLRAVEGQLRLIQIEMKNEKKATRAARTDVVSAPIALPQRAMESQS